jgi:archaeal flagellar protein FlaI
MTDRILEIDDSELKTIIASPQLAPEQELHLKDRDFDRLRVRTSLFTKEYDRDLNLLSIEPFFVDVRVTQPPIGSDLIEQYHLSTGAIVRIYEDPEQSAPVYHLSLPEMTLNFNQLKNLKHEFNSFQATGKTRNEFIKRWYQDFGILEHLLFDENVLEININPPAYKTPIRIVHSKHEECTSNIYPSPEMLEYLSTRLKISTGRPLNRAQTQLDGEIIIEDQRARVAAIIEPFSVFGTGFSIRKHRAKPWTVPLLMKRRSVNSWFAGFMSFVITHGRSFLTAGPRGSGKTSLLGSLLVEILPKYRIITIEDTQELPVRYLKDIGYDLLPLKVRSALLEEGLEMPFDRGLRTSLRLGDSALIIGEIRSTEAVVLYEAMRVGAMSNVVAGTIHADTPYGVYDRVVNDLNVSPGSFKVTDLIIIQKLIKDPSGLSRIRRVVSVTEVKKHWSTDEPEFTELLIYDPKRDELVPTEALMHGGSETIKQIMTNTTGYPNYQAAINDISLRGWAKQFHLDASRGDDRLMEADVVSRANLIYSRLSARTDPLKNEGNARSFQKKYATELTAFLKTIEKR